MAKNSIPTNAFSRNSDDVKNDTLLYQDTALLTNLLQLSHQYYKERSVISEEALIAFLRGLIKWLETTCRENTTITVDYYLNSIEFHRYIHNNLWKQAPTLEPFFSAIAYLVQYGVESFRMQNYPEPYEKFLHQLELLFNNDAIINAGKQRTAYLLLEQLRQKPL
jgi:hypothetical protein